VLARSRARCFGPGAASRLRISKRRREDERDEPDEEWPHLRQRAAPPRGDKYPSATCQPWKTSVPRSRSGDESGERPAGARNGGTGPGTRTFKPTNTARAPPPAAGASMRPRRAPVRPGLRARRAEQQDCSHATATATATATRGAEAVRARRLRPRAIIRWSLGSRRDALSFTGDDEIAVLVHGRTYAGETAQIRRALGRLDGCGEPRSCPPGSWSICNDKIRNSRSKNPLQRGLV